MTNEIKLIGQYHHFANLPEGDIIILPREDASMLKKLNIGIMRNKSGKRLEARLIPRANLQAALHNNPKLAQEMTKAIAERLLGNMTSDHVVHLHPKQIQNMRRAGIEQLTFEDHQQPVQLLNTQKPEGSNLENTHVAPLALQVSKMEDIDDAIYEQYFSAIMELIAAEMKADKKVEHSGSVTMIAPQETSVEAGERTKGTLSKVPVKSTSKTSQRQEIEKEQEEEITETVRAEKRKLLEADQEKNKISSEKEKRAIEKDENHKEIRKGK